MKWLILLLLITPDPPVVDLARLIEAEAAGESLFGKYLVGSVVINRIRDDRFPSSIGEVISQPRQFATPADTFSAESLKAARLAYRKPYGNILFFYNPSISKSTFFNSLTCFDFENHRFCE
jgi:N-acetylmuramoyl-L-alanine amidase